MHEARTPLPLLEPRDGVPPVIDTPEALDAVVARLIAGRGPIAVDAERASGYRYGHRAYLVQLRRQDAGTALIDPVACADLSALGEAVAGTECILHAAGQDLPCLADLGLRPTHIFDTELAGRLLGYQRVGLATMVESILGLRLEKGHAAADWSRRPLPNAWLRYAALDVEVLVELRNALRNQLRQAGKLGWAREEFAHLATTPPPPARKDPWRRTSGIHRARSRLALAAVRELWLARDDVARAHDLSPSRVLPDTAIVEAALAMPRSRRELAKVPGFTARSSVAGPPTWLRALDRARTLPEESLPDQAVQTDGPPPAHRWGDRDPAAAKRLATARGVVATIADEHTVPTENLVQPDAIRRLMWAAASELSADFIADQLRRYGARPWQVDLVAHPLAKALRRLEAKGELPGRPPP